MLLAAAMLLQVLQDLSGLHTSEVCKCTEACLATPVEFWIFDQLLPVFALGLPTQGRQWLAVGQPNQIGPIPSTYAATQAPIATLMY